MVEQWLTQPYLPASRKTFEELVEICHLAKKKQNKPKPKTSRKGGSRKVIKIVTPEEQIEALEGLVPMIRKANPRSRNSLLKSLGMVGMTAEEAARKLEDTIVDMKKKIVRAHMEKGGSKNA